MYDLTEIKKRCTPMMATYIDTKLQNEDCILFYRLGDFYEMFFDDALKASKLLDLTLTGKDCGLENRAPMCGIPYHAAEQYIAKLVAAGEKVAVCEQLEAPQKGKKLVDRGVIRIVTPGTVTEDGNLDKTQNNFIASVYLGKTSGALCWCDITTGQLTVRKCNDKDFISEIYDVLVRVAPAEIIGNGAFRANASESPLIEHGALPKISDYKESAYSVKNAENTLLEQFSVSTLKPFEIENDEESICACGGLIAYLKETQKHALVNVNNVIKERKEQCMTLDYNSLKNLELVKSMRDGKRYGSLLWLLDKTDTAMGSRLLSQWITTPLISEEKINYRLDGVNELYSSAILRGGIDERLGDIRDMERLAGRISNGNATPSDCYSLSESMLALPNIKILLFGSTVKIMQDISDNIDDFTDIAKLIQSAINSDPTTYSKDRNYIRDGFDKELDRLRQMRNHSGDIIKQIETQEKEKTGIRTLKIAYNKVFGYYIEVSNSFKDKVPYNYIRKQTTVNGERYVTEELKNIEVEILSADESIKRIEIEIFSKIKALLAENIKRIQRTANAIACLDVLCSFAKVAKKYNYCKPQIVGENDAFNVVGGRHPVVEASSYDAFVSNDAYIDNGDSRVMIITGPNMAGKSTYMRQNALICVMAQIGSFVPAKSAEIPIVDRIFTRIGANDNIIYNQSTFMVEMTEVATILLHATKRSLLILDEVGRGTSTFDGLGIAWAVVEYLAENVRAKTLFATHYHELSELEGVIEGVKNYKITVKELNGKIVFLRKIMRGSANKSFGIEVAALAGVPKVVTDRAKVILKRLEKNDLTRTMLPQNTKNTETVEGKTEKPLSDAEEILLSTDINSLTPIAAFKLVMELKDKVKEEHE
ncbi:MAG: DNA mismatch repair protein MutS [Candidatus Borkfalkiaceae bacterium]|nr:DNA mismatch repair protein MutS [Christensenellaceae bacterium]